MAEKAELADTSSEEIKNVEPESTADSAAVAQMTLSARLCGIFTLSAVIVAVLYASGSFILVPKIVEFVLVEHPLMTAIITVVLTGFYGLMLGAMLPSALWLVAHGIFLAVVAFWVAFAWWNTLDGRFGFVATPMTMNGLLAVQLALAALAACLSLHEREWSVATKINGIAYYFLGFNMFAFTAVVLLMLVFDSAHEEAADLVRREIDRTASVASVLGVACPVAYSDEYCTALKEVLRKADQNPERRN
jgi:hypothetical protein